MHLDSVSPVSGAQEDVAMASLLAGACQHHDTDTNVRCKHIVCVCEGMVVAGGGSNGDGDGDSDSGNGDDAKMIVMM